MTTSIVIYGATGFTGSLITRALVRADDSLALARADDSLAITLAGRDPSRLHALARELGDHARHAIDVRAAAVHDPAALRAALDGARVVINCAGPSSRIGAPIVAAAVEVGADYIDTTDEQPFMRDTYERYDSIARKAGQRVISGLCFEVALGDFAAHLACEAAGGDTGASHESAGGTWVDEIAIAYAMTRFRPTTGTRQSAIERLSRPGVVWAIDRWDRAVPGAEHRVVRFGDTTGDRSTLSFPSGVIITIPRHCRTRRVQSFLSLSDAGPLGALASRFAPLLRPALPVLFKTPLVAYASSVLNAGPAVPSDEERGFSRFAIMAEARLGFQRQRVTISGSDIYGATVEIVCWALARLLTDDIEPGVLAPSQAFAPAEALDQLAERWPLAIENSF